MVACINGDWPLFGFLIERGADFKRGRSDGITPLFLAVRYGNIPLAKRLMAFGADPSARTDSGRTPLFFAAETGQTEMAVYLLESGVDVNTTDHDGMTPLLVACELNQGVMARRLLAWGAQPNVQDKKGNTPLIWAAHKGNVQLVNQLLSLGVNIDLADLDGCTALHRAAWDTHFQQSKSVRFGRNGIPDDPVELRASFPESLEIVKLLIAQGANVNLGDKNLTTPLMMAAKIGYKERVEYLLKAGADPTLKNAWGSTAQDFVLTNEEIIEKEELIHLLETHFSTK